MESAVRYDFSFPPKSTSINNNSNNLHTVSSNVVVNTCGTSHISHSHSHNMFNNNNNSRNNFQQNYSGNHQVNLNGSNNQNIGLSKSASTSLLTTCASHQNNINNNNNNNPKFANNNICNCCNTAKTDANLTTNNNNNNTFNLNNKSGLMNKNGCNKQSQQNHHPAIIGAPATPKDGNCSFTFDDLKNTLAFMEDSPLVSASNSNNSHVAPPPTQILTVKLDSNAQSDSSTSVSSLSSASSSSSGSSCNSCYVPSYMPKSNSNPMLLSAGSNGSSNTSPTSIHSKKSNNEQCSCAETGHAHQHQQQPPQFQSNTGSVLDLLMKKSSSSDLENNTESHFQHGPNSQNQRQNLYVNSSNSSLVTTANSLNLNSNTLLSSIQQTSQTGINVAIESAARRYRCAAQVSEASCCWKGKLPPKQYKTPIVYSTKVFVGGLPWDITEEDILKEFGQFGPCRVEWTNKEKFNLLSSSQQMENSSYQDNGSSSHHQNNNSNNNSYQYQNSQQSFRNNRSISNLQQNSKQMNHMNGQNNQNGNNNGNNNSDMNASKHRLSPGFTYVIYDNEYSVRTLVGNCIEDYQNGRDRVEYYFKISTRRVRNKEVQIIPWILADNNFALCTPKELDPKKTVFVGNLHGTMTARDLAHIMNELFGCVVYAGIDIDKLKYPIGSGRVTFSHQQNFMKAVRAAFVDIQSSKFSKRIQIDPYLEDVECCMCYADKGIYFCRDFQCFKYYCGGCWEKQHSYNQLGNHKPLMRKREDKIM